MSQVDVNTLKSRFATGAPTPKDYLDLIDTFSAVQTGIEPGTLALSAFESLTPNSVIQTDGSGDMFAGSITLGAVSGGDGSISGSYPAIEIAANGVKTTHINAGAVTLAKISTAGATTGAVMTFSGSAIGWVSPAAVAANTRFINRLISWESPVTAFTISGGFAVTTITIANPQAESPTSFSAVIQCASTDGSFAIGDEVALDEVTNASFESAFTLKINSTDFIVSANCLSSAMQVGSTGITLANWNLVIRAVFTITNAPVSAPTAMTLHGARAAVSYGGFLYVGHSVPTNQSASTYPTSSSPVRGFGYDSTGYSVLGAFLTSINLNNGNILIGAAVTGGNPLPVTDLSVTFGKGSGCYNTFGMAQFNVVKWPTAAVTKLMWIRGNDTYFKIGANPAKANADGSSTDPTLGTVQIPKGGGVISAVDLSSFAYDTTTAAAGALTESSANLAFLNVWGDSSGTQRTFHPYPQHMAIVQVDDSTGNTSGSSGTPDFFVVGSQFFPAPLIGIQASMGNCVFGRYSYVGGHYQFIGPAAGSPSSSHPAGGINFLSTSIVLGGGLTSRNSDIFAAASALNPAYYVMVRYNPVSKRFYVIDACTGMLHIYSLSVTLLSWLGNSATPGNTGTALDYTLLTYNGSFAIPAAPAVFDAEAYEDIQGVFGSASMRDHWSVEFDLTTGVESAITVTRGLQNTIARIPWIWI